MPNFFTKFAELLGGPSASGNVLVWLLRLAFGAVSLGVAFVAFSFYNEPPRSNPGTGVLAFFGILLTSLLVVVADLRIRNKQITTISAVYFGLLLGFLLGTLFATALEPFL